jgi:hypothetical protein
LGAKLPLGGLVKGDKRRRLQWCEPRPEHERNDNQTDQKAKTAKPARAPHVLGKIGSERALCRPSFDPAAYGIPAARKWV